MNAAELVELLRQSLYLVLLLSGPALGASLVVGVVIGVAQATTQIQDAALAHVPKVAAVAIALVAGGSWMTAELVSFTERLWSNLP
jgi:flagellar biosynthetic protein FliQ